jgi:RHS repeat-associated protein
VQLVNVVLIVALFLAVTPTNVKAQSLGQVFSYYHGDHLGSANVLTDQSGAVVQHLEYSAFGQQRFQDNTSAFAVDNRYTGQVFDDDTGLYYYNARYYDPGIGRFTQPDSIVPDGSPSQSLNRYTYVDNNPLNHTDPSGHGNFFSGLVRATFQSFSSPMGIISMLMMGPAVPQLSYTVGQGFGRQTGQDFSIGLNVAMAVVDDCSGGHRCGVRSWCGGWSPDDCHRLEDCCRGSGNYVGSAVVGVHRSLHGRRPESFQCFGLVRPGCRCRRKYRGICRATRSEGGSWSTSKQ